MKRKASILGLVSLAVCSGMLAGCSTAVPDEPRTVLLSAEVDQTLPVGNRVPKGVVRYCWEEPMVEFEPNGPGIDATGVWYKPYHLAVREVRMGKWRPCRTGSENLPSDHSTASQSN